MGSNLNQKNFWQLSPDQLARQLKTNINQGLTNQEVEERLRQLGPNTLPEGKTASWISIFISQFQNPLIYILLLAAIIIFFVGDRKIDAFIISGILFFNAIIGAIQEGRTGNIIASLKRFIKSKSVVIRNGKHEIIDDQDLVVGDIIVLKEGERVPADARIFYTERLNIDESILTGESTPVTKNYETLANFTDQMTQPNMVFRGTYILSGYGKAIVVATGENTRIGTLRKTIEEIKTDIPLKHELDRLSYFILLLIFAICILLLIVGLLTGHPFKELMVMLTALFICVIPEGLPVVLTLVLVTGAYRMARQHVLIKNLQGVEALGRTDVIVIDKTGTLTRNEMMVTEIFTNSRLYEVTGEGYFEDGEITYEGNKVEIAGNLKEIGIACALLNSAELMFNKKLNLFEIKGDPTEAALYVFAKKLGFDQETLAKGYKELCEIPFSSDLKYHAAFYTHEDQYITYAVGAPEIIFQKSSTVPDITKAALARMLEDGLRVVAVARKKLESFSENESEPQACQALITNLELLGLCGIQDSIRPEVQGIIEQARDAGLRIIMATGDHKKTAYYVAKKVGIYKEGDQILEGEQLGAMDDESLQEIIDSITVFARVSPDDKVRIINALHKKNYIVAMTGDGVNDVPSLIAADLGISMGRIGTEVTKQAADLVLLDDSFVNIIHAIEQGRHIFYTLRRVILYFFGTNLGEILIVLFALFSRLPLPLTAAQILWLNFVTDGFLDVGLSMEPQESDLLQATWLKNKFHLVDTNMLFKSFYLALPMGITSLIVFSYTYTGPASLDYARTMTLITMAMFQWFNAWNCRSEGKSLVEIGIFSNRWLIAATLFVLLLQLGLSYFPPLQFIFKTVPLSLQDWAIIMSVSAPIIVIEEFRKFIVRKFFKKT